MTRIYLIRHAEAEGNLFRRIHGQYDSSVTANGWKQIAALSDRFRYTAIDAVYASDLRRTQQTAQSVVVPHGLEIHIDPDLKEIALGEFEDKTFGAFRYRRGDEFRQFVTCSRDFAPAGGETFAQVAQRVSRAFLRIAQRHPDQTVAIFSHGTAIQCLQASLRGVHPADNLSLGHPENTAVSCYEIEDGELSISFENDASHLPEELSTMARQRRRGRRAEAWFKPLEDERDWEFYTLAREEAWKEVHGSLRGYDGPGFLAEARDQWFLDRRAVQLVMSEDQVVGLLHLSTGREATEGAGNVSLLYIAPQCRRHGLGLQALGQAIFTYRAMGRKVLRLRCAPDNLPAQALYRSAGLVRVGAAPGAEGELDILELAL